MCKPRCLDSAPTTKSHSLKTRGLDGFNQVEEDMMTDRTDKATMLSLLRDQSKGSATDKLRLALVYLLSVAEAPKADLDAIEVRGAIPPPRTVMLGASRPNRNSGGR
jgi:hypothetical protein